MWNIKSQEARLVHLTPDDGWGGAGLLGVTIRLDDYAGAEDRLVRVLAVESNSPAAIAGLVPEHDFLLGTTHQTLDSVDKLAVAVLQQNMDKVVELYVFNAQSDVVRVVALLPTYHWGDGDSLLGAEVGTGYLHRLPAATRATSGSSIERKVRYIKNSSTTIADDKGRGVCLEVEPQLEMEPSDEASEDGVESVALETPEQPSRKGLPEMAPLLTPERSRTVQLKTPEVAFPRAPTSSSPQAQSVGNCGIVRAPSSCNGSIPRAPSSANSGVYRSFSFHSAPPRAPSSAGLDPKEVQAIFEKPPPVETLGKEHETMQQHHTPKPVPSPQSYQTSPSPYAAPQQHQPYFGASPTPQHQPTHRSVTEPQPHLYQHGEPHKTQQPYPVQQHEQQQGPPVYTAPIPQILPAHNPYAASPPLPANHTAFAALGPPPQVYHGGTAYASQQPKPQQLTLNNNSNHQNSSAGVSSHPSQSYGTPYNRGVAVPHPHSYSYGSAPLPPPPMGNSQPLYRAHSGTAAFAPPPSSS